MAALTLTRLFCVGSLCVLVFVSADPNIKAQSGQTVTLPCRALDNDPITVLEWSRADLDTNYILLYRDKQFDPENQHPSFKNRVDLQDRQMKDGDVSLILKNVTIADAGKYQCLLARANVDLISIIYLSVDPPGPPGGTAEDGGKEEGGASGVIVGLLVSALVVAAAVVGFLIYRKQKQGIV